MVIHNVWNCLIMLQEVVRDFSESTETVNGILALSFSLHYPSGEMQKDMASYIERIAKSPSGCLTIRMVDLSLKIKLHFYVISHPL